MSFSTKNLLNFDISQYSLETPPTILIKNDMKNHSAIDLLPVDLLSIDFVSYVVVWWWWWLQTW